MKYIVIGLGRFGTLLSERLTSQGHEVLAIDGVLSKVEDVKDKVESAICMNVQDIHALETLPIADADAVFVTINADFGASVYTIALLKQLGAKRIVGRALSSVHKAILEAIGIDETISPELDYAELYATKIDIPSSIGSYVFSEDIRVIELSVPNFLLDKAIGDIDFEALYSLKLLAVKRLMQRKGVLPIKKVKDLVVTDLKENKNYKLNQADHLLLLGKVNDFKKLLEK